MTEYIKRMVNSLNEIYEKNNGRFGLCIINAMKGMGKSTTISEFLNQNCIKNSIVVKVSLTEFQLISMIMAIDSETSDTVLNQFISSTQMQNHIKKRLLEIINKANELVMVFENFEEFDKEISNYILELAKFFINRDTEDTILFIIEQNEKIDFELRNQISHLSRFTSYIQYPNWEKNDLIALINDNYDGFDIPSDCLEQIINCSFKNADVLLNNIEYLKELGYLYIRDSILKCDGLPDDILFNNYKNVVKKRYDFLENELKDAINKAAIVGKKFDTDAIQNAFQWHQFGQLMIEVERVSRLISQIDIKSTLFEFISKDAHELVESYISPKYKKEWSLVLANYYINIANNKSNLFSDMKYCKFALQSANFFEKALYIEECIEIYFKVIPILLNGNFYMKCLEIIDKINKHIYSKCINIDNKNLSIFKVKLHYWAYECNKRLFNINGALKCFYSYNRLVKLNKTEQLRLDYEEAYLLYDGNNTNLAYDKAWNCYNTLIKMNCYSRELLRLKVKVTSLLCSIEETLSIVSFRSHFNEAVEIAKSNKFYDLYYSLLRRSAMVYSGELCISLLKAASRYFALHNPIEYAMTLHNLGAEQLFNNHHDSALRSLNKAYNILFEYGHNGIICVRNALAVYYSICKREYSYSLSLIEDFVCDYNEDFLEMTRLYNVSTIQRKLGNISEAIQAIEKVKRLNQKKNNRFSYFNMYIYAQEGYIAYDSGNINQAWTCFNNFIACKYEDRLEYYISVIKTMIKLSRSLGLELPPQIQDYKFAKNNMGEYLSEERLIFCEVLFWE